MIKITGQDDNVLVPLKVVPNASRDRVMGELEGALKVCVSAAPERGAANKAVCKLVARTLGIRGQQVRIVAGHGSPRKTLSISGLSAEEVRRVLCTSG